MAERRAAIIGAGLGGLALALRLAVRGWRVTIFEQGPAPGGKMNRWSVDGFRFDTGPSLITMPWVFSDLFREAGVDLADLLELRRVDPLADYVFDDATRLRVSASLPEWLETLARFEPGGERRFFEFMNLGARIYELSARTFFRTAPFEPPDRDALAALRHIPLRRAWGPYHRSVASFFRSPHLRRIYERFPTYVGSSPYAIPATLLLIPYLEHAFGGWTVTGGLYRIVEALVDLLARRGVEIQTGARVERILTAGGRVRGVSLAGGATQPFDVVAHNGDASLTGALLGLPGAAPMPEAERSLSGFVMLVGLRRRLPEQAHHTVYFSADYRAEFADLFERRLFPDDPTVYVSMPSRTDRTVAPEGGEALFIMANAPANDGDSWDEQQVAAARRAVMTRLRKGGFPDLDPDIAVATTWTPRRLQLAYGMPGGAIYGSHSHGWRRAFLRPSNRERRVGGLYRVGGSGHPGGGTPTVLLSARITSELIRKHEGQ